jgi:hypothetical protein
MDKSNRSGPSRSGSLMVASRAGSMTGAEFNALSFEDRLEAVRWAEAGLKYRLLLKAADTGDLVAALPAQDLFLMIKELGREEVTEVLGLVTGEQLTAFVDLDCWQQDQFDGREALLWLGLAMTEGEERVLQVARSLDFEYLVLVCKKHVHVLRGLEAYLDDETPRPRTGYYELAFKHQDCARLVGALLECLCRLDESFYVHLLEAVRSEQDVTLEETVFQQRRARLQDLGFADPAEALGVYAFLDPAAFDPARFRRVGSVAAQEAAPCLALSAARPRALLARVLAQGLDDSTAWDLSCLVNRVLAAERAEIGQRDQLRGVLERVYGLLNLALEGLCGDHGEGAAELFASTYLQALFRYGLSRTLLLQRRARALRSSTIGPYLEGPWAALVVALERPLPNYSPALEEGGVEEERPFGDSAELVRCEQALTSLEGVRRLYEEHWHFTLPAPEELDLAGCLPATTAEIGLSHFFLTALANRLLGGEFAPRPLPPAALPALHRQVCNDGMLSDAMAEAVQNEVAALESATRPFVSWCLTHWRQDLCPLALEHLDPRFISGLLLRSA